MMQNNSQKNEAEELKSLQTACTSLYYTNAIYTPKVPLPHNTFDKTKLEYFDFVHLFSSFFLYLTSSTAKTKKVYSFCIFSISNNFLANLLLPNLLNELLVSYQYQVIILKLPLRHFAFTCVGLLAFHAIIVLAWHVKSHHTLDSECVQCRLVGV